MCAAAAAITLSPIPRPPDELGLELDRRMERNQSVRSEDAFSIVVKAYRDDGGRRRAFPLRVEPTLGQCAAKYCFSTPISRSKACC